MRRASLLMIVLFLVGACTPAAMLNVATLGGGETKISNIDYGVLPRQKYDIYLPEIVDEETPVLLFFYGGSWQSGKRSAYRFVGDPLASAGIITAVADYRLFPDVTFPAFVNDGAAAFAALKKRYPNRPIFVMGHSAGAHIASLLALDPKYLSAENIDACQDMAGFIGVSGPYDFLPITFRSIRGVFPEATLDDSQPINFTDGKSPPSLLIHGLADGTVDFDNSTKLAAALKKAGNSATTKLYEDSGHIGIIAAMSGPLKSNAPTRKDVIDFVFEQKRLGYPQCN